MSRADGESLAWRPLPCARIAAWPKLICAGGFVSDHVRDEWRKLADSRERDRELEEEGERCVLRDERQAAQASRFSAASVGPEWAEA